MKAAGQVWDEDECNDIIKEIDLNTAAILDFRKQRAAISEGCCFECNNCMGPWRWTDMEAQYNSIHLAVTHHNIMYLIEKYPIHALNPCPPCMCCCEANYKEDFAPKTKKMIPFEKITDIEVIEAGANELVTPGCQCPPACNPVSLEVPVTRCAVNTAGSHTVELVIEGVQDPKAFRKMVMDLKRGGGGGGSGGSMLAPEQVVMGAAQFNSTEVTRLLQDIVDGQRESNQINREILKALQK